MLSGVLDVKVTKSNCKAVIKRSLQLAGLYQPGQWTRPLGNLALSHLSPEITLLRVLADARVRGDDFVTRDLAAVSRQCKSIECNCEYGAK